MNEQYIIAIISAGVGLFGVAVGSAISWLQARGLSKKEDQKARLERESAAAVFRQVYRSNRERRAV